eukprot:4394603-Amphidinium_carterae.1
MPLPAQPSTCEGLGRWKCGQNRSPGCKETLVQQSVGSKSAPKAGMCASFACVLVFEVTIDSPLYFEHFAGVEYATEVALLSRSVTLRGDAGSDAIRSADLQTIGLLNPSS